MDDTQEQEKTNWRIIYLFISNLHTAYFFYSIIL